MDMKNTDGSLDYFQDIKERLKEKPGAFYPIKCDITKEEDVKRTFTWVKESLGGVDVLVNNAGIFIRAQTCGKINLLS